MAERDLIATPTKRHPWSPRWTVAPLLALTPAAVSLPGRGSRVDEQRPSASPADGSRRASFAAREMERAGSPLPRVLIEGRWSVVRLVES